MRGETGAKKYIILFAILFLPTLLYLLFVYGKGEQNFAHLPFVTYIDEMGEEQNRKAPEFGFVNQDSVPFTSKDLDGKIHWETETKNSTKQQYDEREERNEETLEKDIAELKLSYERKKKVVQEEKNLRLEKVNKIREQYLKREKQIRIEEER